MSATVDASYASDDGVFIFVSAEQIRGNDEILLGHWKDW